MLLKTSSYSSVATLTSFQRLLLDLACDCSASDCLSPFEPFRRGASLTLAEDSSESRLLGFALTMGEFISIELFWDAGREIGIGLGRLPSSKMALMLCRDSRLP